MSLWSVVLAPLIIPLCGVAMATTIVWILMPLPLLQGVARWVIDNAVGAMNTLSLWAADRGSLSLDVTMSRGWCIGIYLLFILFTILLLTHGEEKNRLTKS
jgi:hypothetical protein